LHRTAYLCIGLFLLIGWQVSFANDAHLYKIDLNQKGTAVPIAEAGIELLTVIPDDHALAELTDQQMTRVIRMGYTVDYIAASLLEYSALDETDEYYTFDTLVNQLQQWADMHSDIAVLHNLGTTVENRTIWGMKISDNPYLEEDEIVNYFVGVHHGNEDIGAEVCMYFLDHIFTNYGVDPDVTYWVENREIWVLPVLNPDGYVGNSRRNANNVDVNRNYSFHWGESASYYGPYPFSEVETQVVQDLNFEHHFTMGHSYHSYGEEILYPFAWDDNHPTPDDEFFLEIVWAMAAMNGYDPLISGNLYPHGGEHNDYLYGEMGVMSVTTELWSGPGYNPPSSGILNVCLDNLPNDLYLLERAGGAQITGLVTDAATLEPLEAQYKIVELWDPDEIYPRFSEPSFGRYRALVVPGSWTLEISKSGYTTQTFSNVQVFAGSPTVIDVALDFVGYPDVTVALTPVNPPIIIPSTGGSFDYEVDLNNNSGQPQVADVWIDATLPDGSVFGPLILRSDMNMSAGFSAYRYMTQSVPAGAPGGTYTLNAYAGNYDLNELWSEDHFDFTKSGVNEAGIGYLPPSEGFDVAGSEVQLTALPETISLQAYPNPFNPVTLISYQLPSASLANLSVFDVQGRQVAELLNGWQDAGQHEVTFDASRLTSGVYIYRLQAGDVTASGKMVLMK
jgi:hypothetical protein